MAEFRTIHTHIWEDEWFIEQSSDGKILFMYLFTNYRASVAGIYLLPFRCIPFETGLSRKAVEKLLGEFAKAGKVYYEDGVIWVRNMRHYQDTGSSRLLPRIAKDIDAIPDCNIKRAYCKAYGIDTVSTPYAHGIDTVFSSADTVPIPLARGPDTDPIPHDTDTTPRSARARTRPTKKSLGADDWMPVADLFRRAFPAQKQFSREQTRQKLFETWADSHSPIQIADQIELLRKRGEMKCTPFNLFAFESDQASAEGGELYPDRVPSVEETQRMLEEEYGPARSEDTDGYGQNPPAES